MYQYAIVAGLLLLAFYVKQGGLEPFLGSAVSVTPDRYLRRLPTYVEGPLPYPYPNLSLPAPVVGGGGRRGGTVGGSELVIPTLPIPKDISSRNIAPVTVSMATRYNPVDARQRSHQVGVINKTFGSANDILPLYGAKLYSSTWSYYTVLQNPGGMATKVPILTRNRNEQLATGDPVWIDTVDEEYRVTIYDDGLEYFPAIY